MQTEAGRANWMADERENWRPVQQADGSVVPPPPPHPEPKSTEMREFAFNCRLEQDTISARSVLGLSLIQFSRRTTMHGIAHMAQAKNNRGRLFWLLIMLCATLGFGANLSYIVEKFLEKPTLVNTHHESAMFTFPDISICNMNPLFFPPNGTSEFARMMDLIRDYRREAENTLVLTDFFHRKRIHYGQPRWSFILWCKYGNNPCGEEDFNDVFLWPYGECFTFNPDRLNRSINRDSLLSGILPCFDVILYKAVDYPEEYQEDPHGMLHMPTGALLMIHEPRTYPLIIDSHILDGSSMVKLHVTEKSQLKMHKGQIGSEDEEDEEQVLPGANLPCREKPIMYEYFNMFTNNTASYTGRLLDCINEYIVKILHKHCGCRLPQYPILPHLRSAPFCNDSEICLGDAYSEIQQSHRVLEECYRRPCKYTIYRTSNSFSRYPAVRERHTIQSWTRHLMHMEAKQLAHFNKSNMAELALLPMAWRENNDWTMEEIYHRKRFELVNVEFIERNFMHIRVAPASFFKDRVSETEEYPASRLLSDIGGCVGLWLGASLVTLFELFDLLLDFVDIGTWLGRRRLLMSKQTEIEAKLQRRQQQLAMQQMLLQRARARTVPAFYNQQNGSLLLPDTSPADDKIPTTATLKRTRSDSLTSPRAPLCRFGRLQNFRCGQTAQSREVELKDEDNDYFDCVLTGNQPNLSNLSSWHLTFIDVDCFE